MDLKNDDEKSGQAEIGVFPELPSSDKAKDCLYEDSPEASTFAVLDEEKLAFLFAKMGYKDRLDFSDIPDSVNYVISKLYVLTDEECGETLRKMALDAEDDPNIPQDEYEVMIRYVNPDYVAISEQEQFEARVLATLIKFHSPYVEIRAVVDPTDDPDMPVETFRSYFIAILWTVIGSGFNEFFSHRLVSVAIDMAASHLLIYPTAMLWSKFVPYWEPTTEDAGMR